MNADSDSDSVLSLTKGSLLGRSAPGFTLPSFIGGSGNGHLSLEDFSGRKVILVFLRHFA